MASLPSYLTSGASSRAHHAFLVKLHRAQSDQEEDEVIRHEVQRGKKQLGVRGGASLSVIVDTLIILLHCTVYQHRAGIFQDHSGSGDQATTSAFSTSGGIGREEDWALMAALQVVERAKDLHQRRIGYLYLSERMPVGHELHLMLINTIRKDLESRDPSHTLLALHAIIKQPSTDLAPAVTPLLVAKPLLRHARPAVRQRTIQALMALNLDPSTLMKRNSGFPLSMSKVVRLLGAEEDQSVLCVLLRLLRRLIETGSHIVKGTQEHIYLLQQVSNLMGTWQAGSEIAMEAVRVLRVVSAIDLGREAEAGGMLREAMAVVDEVLEHLMAGAHASTGKSGAFILELCGLYENQSGPVLDLPITLARLLHLITSTLSPASSSSSSTLPPPNDHILVLRCLARLPLDKWDKALGTVEMGVIMSGLESPDDTVRKATLRLLATSAPDVLKQTTDNYLTALKDRSNLALPVHVPPKLEAAQKVQLALHETAVRALEVVFAEDATGKHAPRAAEGVYAILMTLSAPGDESGGGAVSAWDGGVGSIQEFLSLRAPEYQTGFTSRLLQLPSATDPSVLALRASVALDHGGRVDASDTVVALLADMSLAEGSEVQESILAAITSILGSLQTGDTVHEEVQRRLGGVLRDKKMTKHARQRIEVISGLLGAGLISEIPVERRGGTPHEVLQAAETVWKRHEAAREKEATLAIHSPLGGGTASPRTPALSSSQLRYGAYDPPAALVATRHR